MITLTIWLAWLETTRNLQQFQDIRYHYYSCIMYRIEPSIFWDILEPKLGKLLGLGFGLNFFMTASTEYETLWASHVTVLVKWMGPKFCLTSNIDPTFWKIVQIPMFFYWISHHSSAVPNMAPSDKVGEQTEVPGKPRGICHLSIPENPTCEESSLPTPCLTGSIFVGIVLPGSTPWEVHNSPTQKWWEKPETMGKPCVGCLVHGLFDIVSLHKCWWNRIAILWPSDSKLVCELS